MYLNKRERDLVAIHAGFDGLYLLEHYMMLGSQPEPDFSDKAIVRNTVLNSSKVPKLRRKLEHLGLFRVDSLYDRRGKVVAKPVFIGESLVDYLAYKDKRIKEDNKHALRLKHLGSGSEVQDSIENEIQRYEEKISTLQEDYKKVIDIYEGNHNGK